MNQGIQYWEHGFDELKTAKSSEILAHTRILCGTERLVQLNTALKLDVDCERLVWQQSITVTLRL